MDLQRLADLYGCSPADFLVESGRGPDTNLSPEPSGGEPITPVDADRLVTILAEALRESQQVMRLRIEKVEAQQAEAQRMAQENIRRLMEYLPPTSRPHPAGRGDEGAAAGTDG